MPLIVTGSEGQTIYGTGSIVTENKQGEQKTEMTGSVIVSGSLLITGSLEVSGNTIYNYGNLYNMSTATSAGDVSGSGEGRFVKGLYTAGDLGVSGSTTLDGVLTVSPHASETTNGLIATFQSGDTDYCRVNINSTTADGDTQFTFMSNGSSKWSVGNMGSNETLHIKSGFGEFTDSDPFILTNASGFEFNLPITGSHHVRISDDKNLYFGSEKESLIVYRETGDDKLVISGSNPGGLVLSSSIIDIGASEVGIAPGVTTIHGPTTASVGLHILDDNKLIFGSGEDAYIEYDEGATDLLLISGSSHGIAISASHIDIRTTELNLGHNATNNSPAKLNFGAYYDSSGDPSVSHIALYETNGTALYGFGVATNTLVYASNRYHNFYDASTMDGSAVVIDSTALSIVVPGDISGSGRIFNVGGIETQGSVGITGSLLIRGGNTIFGTMSGSGKIINVGGIETAGDLGVTGSVTIRNSLVVGKIMAGGPNIQFTGSTEFTGSVRIPHADTAVLNALHGMGSPTTGQIYYNISTNKLNFYNGSGWSVVSVD